MNTKKINERRILNIKLLKIKILIILILYLSYNININRFLYKILFFNKQINTNKTEILIKGKTYINKCLKGILINKNYNLTKFSQPKISVIIPVFNCQKTIIPSIRSIQNQNLSQFELILVNDLSKDNTNNIIKNLSQQDLRIKIINNFKNMGTLYSRCIGVLISHGKYILALDNDDMFFDEDILDYIYKIGKKKKFDIIELKTLLIDNYNFGIGHIKEHPLSNHKNNLILHQPALGLFPISKNGHYKINDINIWGKGIKNEIYKKSVNSLGYNRYSQFISWAEDTLMVFIIFNIADSFIFLHKYGYIHLCYSLSASFTISDKIKIYGEILLLDVYFDFLKNNTSKNFVVDHIFNNHYKNKIGDKTNEIHFKSIVKKILNCKYITKLNKEKLKKNFIF